MPKTNTMLGQLYLNNTVIKVMVIKKIYVIVLFSYKNGDFIFIYT